MIFRKTVQRVVFPHLKCFFFFLLPRDHLNRMRVTVTVIPARNLIFWMKIEKIRRLSFQGAHFWCGKRNLFGTVLDALQPNHLFSQN